MPITKEEPVWPPACKQEHLDYLDYLVKLRDSGKTNMWGADAYLARNCSISREVAREILLYWIETNS